MHRLAPCSRKTWRIHGFSADSQSTEHDVFNIGSEDTVLMECGGGDVLKAEGRFVNAGGYGHNNSRLLQITHLRKQSNGTFSAQLKGVPAMTVKKPQLNFDGDYSSLKLYTDAGVDRQIDMSVGEAFSAYLFAQFSESQASQHAFVQSLQEINEDANASLRELVEKRPYSPLPSLRGWAFEIERARSFNEDALRKGPTPFRAEYLGVDSQDASDVNIIDTKDGTILGEVQCKASHDHSKVRRAMQRPEYDGMQKVAPAGIAEKAGVSDRISFKGVSSSPESIETTDERVFRARHHNEYPASHVQPPPEPTAAELFRHASVAGLQAGAVGGIVGAVVAGGLSKYHGDDNDKALRKAGRGALQGGTTAFATSFAHTAVAESTGDALVGSAAGAIVGATVGLAWQLERCSSTFEGLDRDKCETTAVGGASGGLAGAVIGQALIPVPILGGFVGGAAGRIMGGFAGAAAG